MLSALGRCTGPDLGARAPVYVRATLTLLGLAPGALRFLPRRNGPSYGPSIAHAARRHQPVSLRARLLCTPSVTLVLCRYTETRDELDETRADYGDLKLQHKLALQQLEEMADELDKMRQKYGHAR